MSYVPIFDSKWLILSRIYFSLSLDGYNFYPYTGNEKYYMNIDEIIPYLIFSGIKYEIINPS